MKSIIAWLQFLLCLKESFNVDTNLGINEVYIQLYNVDGINTIYVNLKCEPDSVSETKAICNAYFSYKGD